MISINAKKDLYMSLLVKVFGSVIIYGIMLSHFLYNNSDAIWTGTSYIGTNWELSLGRWAIRYFDIAQYGVHVHPISSVITLVLFIIGTMLMCNILEIQYNTWADYIMSFLFLSNAVVSVSLSYLYTSHVYGGAFMFAILAVYLIKRAAIIADEKKITDIKVIGLIILSAFSVAFMLGLYQAYLGSVCVMGLAYLVFCIGEKKLKYIGKYIACGLISGGLGLVIYKIILEIELKRYNVQLSDYHNANAWSLGETLAQAKYAFRETYRTFHQYLMSDYPKWNLVPYKVVEVALLALIVVLLVEVYFRRKSIVDLVVTVALVILFPPIANIVMILIPNSGMQIQQSAPMAMAFACIVALVLKLELPFELVKKPKEYIAIGLGILVLWGSVFQVTADQETLRECSLAAENFGNSIVAKLIEEDLYSSNYRYAIVGSAVENPMVRVSDVYDNANNYAKLLGPIRYGTTDGEVWRGTFGNILGNGMNMCQYQEYNDILYSDEVMEMAVFPEDDSVRVINDVVVIRVSNWNW